MKSISIFNEKFTKIEMRRMILNSRKNINDTSELLSIGREIRSGNLTDVEYFIKNVCRWGGYAGIAGRILKNNKKSQISKSFEEAVKSIHHGDRISSIFALNALAGLGQVSFASKHLRFIAPESCVVFDSVLAAHYGVKCSVESWVQFSKECERAATVISPKDNDENKVQASDIEMAIFNGIRNG